MKNRHLPLLTAFVLLVITGAACGTYSPRTATVAAPCLPGEAGETARDSASRITLSCEYDYDLESHAWSVRPTTTTTTSGAAITARTFATSPAYTGHDSVADACADAVGIENTAALVRCIQMVDVGVSVDDADEIDRTLNRWYGDGR